MAKNYVFSFDKGGIGDVVLLGDKGANLAQIHQMGLNIPFGFTITTDGCKYYLQSGSLNNDILEQIMRGVKAIEKDSGMTFGDPTNPLLLSVRTGAYPVTKGLAPTIINVGMNDVITSHLVKQNKTPVFAWECYARFMRDYCNVVGKIDLETLRGIEADIRASARGIPEPEILQKVVSQYKKLYKKETKQAFPQDVTDQLLECIKAALSSCKSPVSRNYLRAHNLPLDAGCAVSVQAMAFGNYDMTSGVGVVNTRNLVTGEKEITGEILRRAQEKSSLQKNYTYDMAELKQANPSLYLDLQKACEQIENFYQDVKSIEFCVQSGTLYIMQVEDAARSPFASAKIALDLCNEKLIDRDEAISKVDANGMGTLMQSVIDPMRAAASSVLAEGVSGYPGSSSGVIVLSVEAALTYSGKGENVIFIKDSFSVHDTDGIAVSSGIVALQGGYNSFASIIAKSKALPCIIGCKRISINMNAKTLKMGGLNYKEGDKITIDADKAKVYGEALPLIEPNLTGDFGTLISWAKAKQNILIYADADTPARIKRAQELGANGVGLVRTENMFFHPQKLNSLRQFFIAPNDKCRTDALKAIYKYQFADFIKLLTQNGDDEINIRLLDITISDVLPNTVGELQSLAKTMGVSLDELKAPYYELKQTNPTLGIRGCRMLIMHPEFIDLQVSAIFNAAFETKRRTGKMPKINIIIPMVTLLPEYEILEKAVRTAAEKVLEANKRVKCEYMVGCMIETPRACLIADKLAEVADFVTFGTNDLTQLTYGFSRDDCMKFLQDYYDDYLIYKDPFVMLDRNGVFELINLAVQKIRSVKENMPIWLLGDIVSDPESIALALKLNINRISCVPNKIPGTILAIAQANIKEEKSK
mgnify:CR=1 FL=1